MMLQNITLFCALIVAFLSTSIAAQHTPAPSPALRSPEVVLREFYKWYIRSIKPDQKATDPYKGGRATLKKYVSLRFIRAIDRNDKLPPESDAFDADYFLLDQDTSGFSEQNVSVSNVVVKGATATATVNFGNMVKVSLIQEGGVWKIDKVKNKSGTGLVK